jgi:hypothetical protein
MSPENALVAELPQFDPSRPHPDRDRERFCQELIVGASLYAAFETAGFKRPRGNAQRMLAEPDVAARLIFLQEKFAPLDDALLAWRRLQHRRALEHIAEADRTELFEERTGYVKVGKRRRQYRSLTVRSLATLTEEQKALIESIEVSDKGVVKVTMPKRLEARAMLAKLDGFDKPTKISPTDPDGNAVLVEIVRFSALTDGKDQAAA